MTNDAVTDANAEFQTLFHQPRIVLYEWLRSEHTTLETLNELCFYLQIEEDALRNHTKQARARELIVHCERLRLAFLYCLADKLYPAGRSHRWQLATHGNPSSTSLTRRLHNAYTGRYNPSNYQNS